MHYIKEAVINYKKTNYKSDTDLSAVITHAEKISVIARALLPDNSREHFLVFYLDSKNVIIAFRVTSSGTLDSTPAVPREIYQPAFLCPCKSIVAVHNHPSDSLIPSDEDNKVTRTLRDAGKLLCLPLLDHIIINETNYYSYQENTNLL